MVEFLLNILSSISNFLYINWLSLCWLFLAFYALQIIKKSSGGAKWLDEQFDWLKEFFADDKTPGSPSHKNLIGITMIIVFCVTFLKKVVSTVDIPDIPPGWQVVILGILGIRSLQGAAEGFAKWKYGNRNYTDDTYDSGVEENNSEDSDYSPPPPEDDK